MLVRASAIPVVEMIKAADAVDTQAAALWLHMALWDTLGEMVDESRPEIDRVWKSVVSARSDEARRVLVRQAVERRVDGDVIDDVVKAAAGLSLVRGYVAKESTEDRSHLVEHEARDARGRWTRQEVGAYDALDDLTRTNDGLRGRAGGVAGQMQGTRYDQMRVVGNALVATGHPKAMAAGGAVRVAAEVGPSAEDVLGTHLRRAAYRYRGTEKRPDRQLLRETKEAQAYVAGLHASPRNESEARVQAEMRSQLEGRKPGEWGKGAVAYRMGEAQQTQMSEDQVEMRATGDIAAAYFMRHLPSQDEAFLSQEAGRTPPSVGVIIDRDGDVVSEAMGYNGDHYVPFDLKNLSRLQGGSYVRTRALGGPTSEDIYTGLLAGARQVQVVSRSGVFTIEFDPDLRGGRRYSDKARQMVDRYSRLLDIVEGGKDRKGSAIYTTDVDEDVKRDLWRKAMVASEYDEDEARVRFDRALKQERAKAGIGYTQDDLDVHVDQELKSWIRNRVDSGHAPSRTEIGRAREQIRDEVSTATRLRRQAGSPQQLRLNAEGYYRAMQSLRREFPYYIRGVDYESLPDFEERRRTRQLGEAPLGFGAPGAASPRTHVRRGRLLPEDQARVYGVGQNRTSADTGEDEGAPAGGGPKSAPAASASEPIASFADTLKNPKFQDQVALQARVLQVADLVPALPKPAEGGMDRDYAAQALDNNGDFVKWLTSPANTVTHGDSNKIAQFITEEATPQELRRISDGLDQIASTHELPPMYSRDRVDSFRKLVLAIGRARSPYADASGDPALHEPNRDEPKPYPFPEIARAAMATDEKFDKVRSQMEADEGTAMEEALSWANTISDERAAAQLRRDAQNFKAAIAWGQDRVRAKKDGVDVPVRPDDVEPDISGADAEEMAGAPTKSPAYKELLRRQRAWAWKYTQRLRSDLRGVMGGGAGPKVEQPAIEGTKSARLDTSSRRVVWHSPSDPLSRAFAKRSSRRRG